MAENSPLPPDSFPLSAENPWVDAHEVISRYFARYPEPLYDHRTRSVIWEADARQIVSDNEAPHVDLLCAGVERLNWLRDQANASEADYSASLSGGLRNCSPLLYYLTCVLGEKRLLFHAHEADALTRQVAALFAGDVSDIVRQMPNYRLHSYGFSVETVVRQWEWFYKEQPATPAAEEALLFVSRTLKSQSLDRKNRSRLAARIDRLLGVGAWPDPGEPWADAARAEVGACAPETAAEGEAQMEDPQMEDAQREAKRLVEAFLEVKPWTRTLPASAEKTAILKADPAVQREIVRAFYHTTSGTPGASYRSLVALLLARDLPITADDLAGFLRAGGITNTYYANYEGLFRQVARLAGRQGLPDALQKALVSQRDVLGPWDAERKRLRAQLEALLSPPTTGLPDAGERWADAGRRDVGGSSAWAAVFSHAATAESSKPSARWLAEAVKNRLAVGDTEFEQRVAEWLKLAAPPPPFTLTAPPLPPDYDHTTDAWLRYRTQNREAILALEQARAGYLGSISEKNIIILKGLSWYASACDSAALARALAHMAEAAFQNVPDRGAWAKSAGNAALWALGQMPGGVGVGPLARLRTRLRDRSALKLIASSIEAAAQSANMTVDELEDLAVPTGGLGADGTRRETFGAEGTSSSDINLVPQVGGQP